MIRARRRSVLPGFGLALGCTVAWLGLIVLVPLAALVIRSMQIGASGFLDILGDDRVQASLRVTFACSFAAAALDVILGLLIAWVLVRYPFPGRRFLDGLVDLPFALPTAVSGIALTALFGPQGWIGRWLDALGIAVVYTPLGITLALTFIGLPFVVRTAQPALEEIAGELEEAASSLGASPAQIASRVILPLITPAVLTGFALAFARGVGEYGSVVFISGNMPYRTEIAPLLIITKLEQYDYAGATAIAAVMLVASFLLLLVINLLQKRARRYALAGEPA
jgi:sulfate transport system permease protein